MIRPWLVYLPALLWAALLLLLGSIPDVGLPRSDLPLDKAAHFLAYGVLGALACWGWHGLRRPPLGVVLLGAIGIALADELHQRSVPGRAAEPADVIADAAGIAAGAGLIVLVLRSRTAP
ncbi:MAG: VanZ family protein [Longimicrobiales bacterium]